MASQLVMPFTVRRDATVERSLLLLLL